MNQLTWAGFNVAIALATLTLAGCGGSDEEAPVPKAAQLHHALKEKALSEGHVTPTGAPQVWAHDKNGILIQPPPGKQGGAGQWTDENGKWYPWVFATPGSPEAAMRPKNMPALPAAK